MTGELVERSMPGEPDQRRERRTPSHGRRAERVDSRRAELGRRRSPARSRRLVRSDPDQRRDGARIAKSAQRPEGRQPDQPVGVIQPLEHRQRRQPGRFGSVGVLSGHALDDQRGRQAHLAAVLVERRQNDGERGEGVVAPERRQRTHSNRRRPGRGSPARCARRAGSRQGGGVRQHVEAQHAIGGRPLGVASATRRAAASAVGSPARTSKRPT